MPEYIRSIHVKIEVDTNKRTHVLDQECESLNHAEHVVSDFLDQVQED